MALTAAQLACLTDEELLRVATHEADELTSSPMELELIKRMGDLIDDQKAFEPLAEIIGTRAKDVQKFVEIAEALPSLSDDKALRLLNVLSDQGVTEASDLEAALKLHAECADSEFDDSEIPQLLTALADAEVFSLQQLEELLQTTNQ